MRQVHVRRAPSTRETASSILVAVGLGAVVGAVAFYLTRAFLARDVLHELSASVDQEAEEAVEEPE